MENCECPELNNFREFVSDLKQRELDLIVRLNNSFENPRDLLIVNPTFRKIIEFEKVKETYKVEYEKHDDSLIWMNKKGLQTSALSSIGRNLFVLMSGRLENAYFRRHVECSGLVDLYNRNLELITNIRRFKRYYSQPRIDPYFIQRH